VSYAPGPWYIKNGDGCRDIYSIKTGELIARVTGGNSETDKFNAALIVLAPALLEAIKAIHKVLLAEGKIGTVGGVDGMAELIAKAEGKP
jgi:hypothetical protein